MDRLDSAYERSAASNGRCPGPANDLEISQISRDLIRIGDPGIVQAIAQLSERLAALLERTRCDGRTIHYSPPFSELLVNEPHGVPFCR